MRPKFNVETSGIYRYHYALQNQEQRLHLLRIINFCIRSTIFFSTLK